MGFVTAIFYDAGAEKVPVRVGGQALCSEYRFYPSERLRWSNSIVRLAMSLWLTR